jgi:hypothetical protein
MSKIYFETSSYKNMSLLYARRKYFKYNCTKYLLLHDPITNHRSESNEEGRGISLLGGKGQSLLQKIQRQLLLLQILAGGCPRGLLGPALAASVSIFTTSLIVGLPAGSFAVQSTAILSTLIMSSRSLAAAAAARVQHAVEALCGELAGEPGDDVPVGGNRARRVDADTTAP